MRATTHEQDQFFRWAMIFLPVLSLCAYVFDAYFYYFHTTHASNATIYEGLLSTIVLLFAYLQYCVPLESRSLLCVYYVFLWVLNEVGHIGYVLACIHNGNIFTAVILSIWMVLDTIHTVGLLYCRVYRQLDYFIDVKNKHIFHFISRLEFMLAIFIPVFINQDYTTITRDNIAFFLLFDFFSETYEKFKGAWIKSCLYLFVTFVTVSVSTEWLYVGFKNYKFEQIMEVSELIAGCFCYALIIMQFFGYHFKEDSSADDTDSQLSRASRDDAKIIVPILSIADDIVCK